jgi:hypothetical protein
MAFSSLTKEHSYCNLLKSTRDHLVIKINIIPITLIKVLVDFFTSLGLANIGLLIVKLCY